MEKGIRGPAEEAFILWPFGCNVVSGVVVDGEETEYVYFDFAALV